MVNMLPKPKAERGKAESGIGAKPAHADEGADPPHIYLTHEHLDKLGIKQMPAVGTKLHLHAIGHVGATSENQDRMDGGKKRRSMTLHLHQMEMGTGKQPEISDEDQNAGAKAEIDKALAKGASSDNSNKSKPAGRKEGGKGG
jgi:hypothetical protein